MLVLENQPRRRRPVAASARLLQVARLRRGGVLGLWMPSVRLTFVISGTRASLAPARPYTANDNNGKRVRQCQPIKTGRDTATAIAEV